MNKDKQINVRVSEEHVQILQKLVNEGKAKTISGALVFLVQHYGIFGGKK
ncbi:hypothetical protein [Pectobacterium odoriferum]|nr:hypothetical protein [Pectobacterium odoriferum]MCA6962178.1 hypothetical protein [Pectobacterium odoriferum]MCH5010277.1 hypothetical protein [Pectobacterium odoriferum]